MSDSTEKFVSFFHKAVKIYAKHLQVLNSDDRLRIVSEASDKDPYFVVQYVGRNIYFKALPQDLMRSDGLLSFSKADIALIGYFGAKAELKKQQQDVQPKLLARIAQQLFGMGGKTKFLLKMPEQDQLVEAVPEEVIMNKEALDMLSGKDAAMLGYAAAENRLLDIRKQVSQAPTCRIVKHDLIDSLVAYIDEERDTQHTLPLADIFNNKKLLNLFSKVDQQMISFSAGEAHKQRIAKNIPAFKVVSQSGEFFVCQDAEGEEQEVAFIDIAYNEDLLLAFSPRDQHLIRFVAGELHAKKTAEPPVLLKVISQPKDIVEYVDADGAEYAMPILDLAFNRELLEQFSVEAREKIVFAAGELHEQRLHPRKSVTLTLKSYLGDVAQFTDLDGNVQNMRFQELAFESELLDQFGQQDRDMIRFAAGEFSAQEKAAL